MKCTKFVFLILLFGLTVEASDLPTTATSQGMLPGYQSNYKLRDDRKVGLGLGVGGSLGGFGGLFDLNIEDENSTLIGFGTGSGYQTFGLAWKRSFEGEYFTPYTTAGYSRWWDSGSKSQADRSSVLRNLLSNSQKQKSQFGLDLVTGSFGMQYNQLTGDLAGSSFYFEFGALVSLHSMKLLPTGSVGTFYYF